jgi:hypothetical protein
MCTIPFVNVSALFTSPECCIATFVFFVAASAALRVPIIDVVARTAPPKFDVRHGFTSALIF